MMKYTKEMREFLASYIPGHKTAEIQTAFFDLYGIQLSGLQIKGYKATHGLKSGTMRGFAKGTRRWSWDVQAADYVLENYTGIGPKEMAGIVNEKFGLNYTPEKLKCFYHNNHLDSGISGCFTSNDPRAHRTRPGDPVPEEFLNNRFKKGNIPHNVSTIGTELVRSDGYLWRKISEPNKWRQVHRILWEENNGPIPEGHKLIFLDGNRLNISLENLRLISNDTHMEMVRTGLRFDDKDLTNVATTLAELRLATRAKKKHSRGQLNDTKK